MYSLSLMATTLKATWMWSGGWAGMLPLLVQPGWVLAPVLWLPECSGLVFHSVCSAVAQVSAKEVEFKTVYKRHALKEAVIEEVYPPSITVKAIHREIPRHLRCPRFIHLHVSGAKSGCLTFPVEVSEEKECECVRLVRGTWSYEVGTCNFQDVCMLPIYVCWSSFHVVRMLCIVQEVHGVCQCH